MALALSYWNVESEEWSSYKEVAIDSSIEISETSLEEEMEEIDFHHKEILTNESLDECSKIYDLDAQINISQVNKKY